MIPYSRQQITAEDIEAVNRVLRSDYLTQGPAVPAFEAALCHAVGGRVEAVAMSSATAALHVACLAFGVGPGDTIWTSPISFVASANCALYCGAGIDFVDIDPATFNLSVGRLKEKLANAKLKDKLPKLVIPVHMGGLPADLKAIRDLSQEYGFKVLEDASHALGARYLDSTIGDCRYSDAAILSFHPVKMITTGEGGALLSRDPKILAATRLLRTHGISREPSLLEQNDEGAWYYEQSALGFNYRMTDIQAALGESQLRRLRIFVDKRQALAAFYDEAFAQSRVRPQRIPEGYSSSYHLYLVQIPDPSRRKEIFETMRAKGFGVNVHYIPIHTQPYYRRLGFKRGDYPVAESYYEAALSLPLFPDLAIDDARQAASILRELCA